MRSVRRFWLALPAAAGLLLAAPGASPQQEGPKQPLDEIVRRFAEKEEVYARAHSLYRYRLTVKIQELEGDNVLGEFEEAMDVGFDASGRRRATLRENPHNDLHQMSLTRLELEDLDFVPLFILSPQDIPDYEITYVSRERLDEVETYLFRLEPARPVRPGERFFEGIVWVDAEKLDIVRVHGRSLPARTSGPLGGYFQRMEIYREPVDDYLFPTFARADDVLAVRDRPVRARLILRFSDHERVRQPAAAAK